MGTESQVVPRHITAVGTGMQTVDEAHQLDGWTGVIYARPPVEQSCASPHPAPDARIETMTVEESADIEAAWVKEIARRVRDYEEGTVRGIPSGDALREARRRLCEASRGRRASTTDSLRPKDSVPPE